MSSLLRHRNLHQTNVTRFFYFGPFPIKNFGYASVSKKFIHETERNSNNNKAICVDSTY